MAAASIHYFNYVEDPTISTPLLILGVTLSLPSDMIFYALFVRELLRLIVTVIPGVRRVQFGYVKTPVYDGNSAAERYGGKARITRRSNWAGRVSNGVRAEGAACQYRRVKLA